MNTLGLSSSPPEIFPALIPSPSAWFHVNRRPQGSDTSLIFSNKNKTCLEFQVHDSFIEAPRALQWATILPCTAFILLSLCSLLFSVALVPFCYLSVPTLATIIITPLCSVLQGVQWNRKCFSWTQPTSQNGLTFSGSFCLYICELFLEIQNRGLDWDHCGAQRQVCLILSIMTYPHPYFRVISASQEMTSHLRYGFWSASHTWAHLAWALGSWWTSPETDSMSSHAKPKCIKG